MTAREALYWALWDNYTQAEKNAFIDAHRDEVALEIGCDALRDGLAPTLARLVGEVNAAKLMADFRRGGGGNVTARDDLIAGLVEHACCFSEEDATRMVDAFAHELAEHIRDERPQWGEAWRHHGEAADRIDPVKDTP